MMLSQPLQILFSGHDLKFLTPLIDHCKSSADYRVLIDEHEGHQITDSEKCARLAAEAEIIFCEWALGNAVWYSHHKRADQILVVRLHLQEMDLPYLDEIKWSEVDHLVFICPENQIEFIRKRPHLEALTELIYNPISCQALNQTKLPGAEFNLGFIGIVPMRKRADLATDILLRLKKIDRRFSLYFKGRMPHEYPWMLERKKEMAYYNDLYEKIDTSSHPNAISFEPHGQDMPEWFRKIGFILSTSDFEGSHQAVAEGMASGAVPIIRNWAGADKLYPSHYVYSEIDQAVELVDSLRQPENYTKEAEASRSFAQTHFDSSSVCDRYEKLFREAIDKKTESTTPPQTPKTSPPSTTPILHVCFLKPGIESGYRVRVMTEVSLLRQRGHPVHLGVYTPRTRPSGGMNLEDFAQDLADRTDAAVSLIETDHFFDLELNEAAMTEMIAPLIDLAHREGAKILHGQALYASRAALYAAKKAGDLRVVFDCHGITPEETFMSGGHFSRMQSLEELEQEMILSADLTILVSESMRDHFKTKYGHEPRRDLIVPCCVNADRFDSAHASRTAFRNELGINEKFVLGYIGTLASWQWPEAMFKLYSELSKLRDDLHLMLMIPENDHGRALDLLKEAGIPEHARSLREVPSEEVGKMLPIFDAGLLLREAHPVNRVSSPTKFGEYLAAGVPVIATEGISDFSRWISDHHVGITLDHDDLSSGTAASPELSQFLDAVQSEREAWRERCNRLCEEKLSWGHRIRDLSSAYSDLG